jgi:hypothetical protein
MLHMWLLDMFAIAWRKVWRMQDLHGAYALWRFLHSKHMTAAIDSRSTAPDTWEEAAMQANAAAQWHRKCFAKQLH